jgi:hypothetical protein
MALISRAQWGARDAAKAEPLDAAKVVGLAIHWPGMEQSVRGLDAVSKALQSWQSFHLSKGWRDIAYQVAVDQDGNRYELRGLDGVSAANGDTDTNARYGAVLVILAPGEAPTAAMLSELRRVVADHRRLFPKSTRVVGHQDIRPEPTACPGPVMESIINAGLLEPRPTSREVIRKRLNAAQAEVKAALEDASRRPRLRYQLERARKALSKARKINRG